MTCFFCHGVAHPATGHAYTPTVLCCGPCYRVHLPWLKGRLHGNPIAAAASNPPGTVLSGAWTAHDEAKSQLRRAKRRASNMRGVVA